MAAAVVASNNTTGRGAGFITAAFVPVLITLTATPYATATGGLPFDIASLLNTVGPPVTGINPLDIVGFLGFSIGAMGGLLPASFSPGTPTYTPQPGVGSATPGVGTLATCPATLRLYVAATGAEVADGNLTGTISGFLVVSRGGHN